MLLGVALGAKEPGERGLAADVVGFRPRGRPDDAARPRRGAVRGGAAIGRDRPNRWALSLADVAALSNDHAAAVASAVGRTMPALAERPPAKLVPLLRLLDETSAASGSAPDPAAGPPLSTIAATGGQAGRLARSILGRG